MRLKRSFFLEPTLKVAKNLLGKTLVIDEKKIIINETEAYVGQDDPACHATRGMTARTAVMFGSAGFSYVYLIYGMYHCLNLVTEKEGFPAAVLIRGGYDIQSGENYNGPGKLCRHLGITKHIHNNIDIISATNFYVEDIGISPKYECTPRIGIKVGTDKLWRFIATSNTMSHK